MSDKQPSPREIRSARTRQAILDAGLHLLRSEGLEKISLRAIAREIDYSAAALYEYFNNKEELLAAMTIIIGDELYKELQLALLDLENPLEKVQKIGLTFIHFAVKHPHDYQLFSTQPFSPYEDSSASGCTGDSFTLLAGLLQQCLDEGLIHNPNDLKIEEIAMILWGVVHGLATLQNAALQNAAIDQEKINTETMRILTRGLG